MKNKYNHPKINWEIVHKDKINTHNTRMHDISCTKSGVRRATFLTQEEFEGTKGAIRNRRRTENTMAKRK